MKEQRVAFEECEAQKRLVLVVLFVEIVAVVAVAAAAYCLSVTAHGQLTSLYQSAAVPNDDASCETGAVWHHTGDKLQVGQIHCSSSHLLQQ
jgi:hypothetical protein